MYASDSDRDHGKLLVDRGVLLLQRSLTESYKTRVSIRAFDRSKLDDTLPDLVIPASSIDQIKYKRVKSLSGSMVKGVITIKTQYSLNTQMTLEPMTITIKLSLGGCDSFRTLYNEALLQWPNT